MAYGTPHQRGRAQVIEDLVSLYQIPITANFNEKISNAYSIPGNEDLEIRETSDGIQVIIPEFRCHKAVVFEYD